MFAKSLQWRDGDDLAVDVDDEHTGGGWSPPEVDSGGVSPSDLLRRQPSVSLFLVLCFSATSPRNSSGGYFYRRF